MQCALFWPYLKLHWKRYLFILGSAWSYYFNLLEATLIFIFNVMEEGRIGNITLFFFSSEEFAHGIKNWPRSLFLFGCKDTHTPLPDVVEPYL